MGQHGFDTAAYIQPDPPKAAPDWRWSPITAVSAALQVHCHFMTGLKLFWLFDERLGVWDHTKKRKMGEKRLKTSEKE